MADYREGRSVVGAYTVDTPAVQKEVVVLDDGTVFFRWAGEVEWQRDAPVPTAHVWGTPERD